MRDGIRNVNFVNDSGPVRMQHDILIGDDIFPGSAVLIEPAAKLPSSVLIFHNVKCRRHNRALKF